jgi:hypothetical protein
MKGISRWIKSENLIKKNDKNYIEFATLTKLFFKWLAKRFLLIEKFY